MPDVESAPQWATEMAGNRRREEKVIYYRNKRGWITWGDTQPSKQLHMLQKGCTPLPQYGFITDSTDLWGPILRHPQGPSEFPVDQILAYRWYKSANCPVKTAKFPQLAGQKIVEFPCPECARTPFHNPIDLGSHLRVMHGYDRSEVLKYGEAMNIDFSKIPGGKEVIEIEYGVEQAVMEVEQDAEEVFSVATVSSSQPATEAVLAEIETENPTVRNDCADCGWVNEKNTEAGLKFHQARWCKKQAVTA